MNEYIVFDWEQAELEQAYLNELALDNTCKNLEYASSEIDRLKAVLNNEETDLKQSMV